MLGATSFLAKIGQFLSFGPFWPMSKCAQLSYLISKNLQNSVQPNVTQLLKLISYNCKFTYKMSDPWQKLAFTKISVQFSSSLRKDFFTWYKVANLDLRVTDLILCKNPNIPFIKYHFFLEKNQICIACVASQNLT